MRLRKKKSMFLEILGESKIVSLSTLVAGDGDDVFAFRLLLEDEDGLFAGKVATFEQVERVGHWVDVTVCAHRADELFNFHFNN